ncbi:hypothetical protein ALP10_00438 [Pseudomonas syringae pv. helianthi]|uniref:Uncharacterized protein n=1 Tax=Pseudomonas syringae pv. helianthi TaxID=251654 RepID=A0A3M6CMM1_9PSED|nr:hypothetical protein [Pseudomonas syringae group genomosp. 7]MDU8618755.1 hypothetical protein [Pseudomonas syringae]RMV45115.1 hypothetical protein ALP10_00438 [Pseudomonas syringae pv. helianthi]
MAKAFGALLGLVSLLYSIFLILHGWHRMSQSFRVYVLIMPSIFATVAALSLLFSVRILAARLVRHIRGAQAKNEFAFMDGNAWSWLVLPVWIATGLGLYSVVERWCG